MTYFKLQNTTKSICLCVLFTFLSFVSFSQSTHIDSLSGFNQLDVAIMAHQNGCYGSETKVFIDMMKRNFINQKFNLNRSPSINLKQGKYHPATIASAPCIDEDFEGLTTGNLVSTSWISEIGDMPLYNFPCTANAVTYTSNSVFAKIITTPHLDSRCNNVANSPLGGTMVLSLNKGDTIGGSKPVRVR